MAVAGFASAMWPFDTAWPFSVPFPWPGSPRQAKNLGEASIQTRVCPNLPKRYPSWPGSISIFGCSFVFRGNLLTVVSHCRSVAFKRQACDGHFGSARRPRQFARESRDPWLSQHRADTSSAVTGGGDGVSATIGRAYGAGVPRDPHCSVVVSRKGLSAHRTG